MVVVVERTGPGCTSAGDLLANAAGKVFRRGSYACGMYFIGTLLLARVRDGLRF